MADRRHGTPPPPTATTIRSEDWYGSDLSGQQHAQVAFVDVDLTEANTDGAVFAECIGGVRMREIDLVGARGDGASFRDCDLSGAWLHRTNLTGCDLRGSDLSGLDPRTTDVGGAIIDPRQAVVIAGALGLDVRPD